MEEIEKKYSERHKRRITRLSDMLEGKVSQAEVLDEIAKDEPLPAFHDGVIFEDIITEDEAGNRLSISRFGEIKLLLSNATRTRRLGRVSVKRKVFYTERTISKSHLHEKSDSWGFNYACLCELQKLGVDRVVLYETDEKRTYSTLISNIVKTGQFLYFKQQGFEKQIFLERSKFLVKGEQ